MTQKFFFKRFIFFVLLLFFSAQAENLNEDLSIKEINTELFIVTHVYPWPSNSLIALMENNDILLIDTPYTPEAAYKLLDWIYYKFGKRNIIAVNTHFHIDRLGGNEALVRSGIPIYSSELTVNAIKERGRRSVNQFLSWIKDDKIKKFYQDFKYVQPTIIFNSGNGLTLRFGNETAEVKYLGAGHAIDNLIVYLPKKKTIFGGCLLLDMEAKNAGNYSDGNINEWKKTIEKINTKNYEMIIPGHGKESGIELLIHTKEVLANLR